MLLKNTAPRLLLFIILLIVGLVFTQLNGVFVSLDLFVTQVDRLNLFTLVVGTFSFGVVLGFLASFPKLLRQRYEIRKLRKEISRLGTTSAVQEPRRS